MTVIAAISDGKKIWMGADSYLGNGSYTVSVAQPKIWKAYIHKEDGIIYCPVLIGTSGDFRGDMILRRMKMPYYKGNSADWAFEFAESMRTEFKEYGYASIDNGKEDQDLHVLLGVEGRIFSIWDNYDVIESSEGYMAIGSGMYVALGALHATDGLLEQKERLEWALDAAATHNIYVRPPFHVEWA